ncbi:hypothetical protein V6N13_130740 [Hibiscus sabdariffa]
MVLDKATRDVLLQGSQEDGLYTISTNKDQGTKVFESEAVPVLSGSRYRRVAVENMQDVLPTEEEQEANVLELNLNDTRTCENIVHTYLPAPCFAHAEHNNEQQVEVTDSCAANFIPEYTDTVAPCCAPDNGNCEEQVEPADDVTVEIGSWSSSSQEHGLAHRGRLVEEQADQVLFTKEATCEVLDESNRVSNPGVKNLTNTHSMMT